jgi:hypothetical protein
VGPARLYVGGAFVRVFFPWQQTRPAPAPAGGGGAHMKIRWESGCAKDFELKQSLPKNNTTPPPRQIS